MNDQTKYYNNNGATSYDSYKFLNGSSGFNVVVPSRISLIPAFFHPFNVIARPSAEVKKLYKFT